MKTAKIGSVSTGTLLTADLLSAFVSTLEGPILTNGAHFARPENRADRDRLNSLIGEAQDCFADDGDGIDPEKEDIAGELTNESLPDALNEFAPPYCYFGAHPGDGADFGFWPDEIDNVKEQVAFVSVVSRAAARALGIDTDPADPAYPPASFRGEWLHVNERGNCTLYVREERPVAGQVVAGVRPSAEVIDRELWSVV